ncbi:preprotein translocase subunit YajC [Alkaliphilus oremlandii]|uniref:Preprotein translocase, YajC subunit n=1 Tax=Alkaliphilus oremlandii (strain OhILAs) TaxID=350688 RepID=A8MGN8_ALKOO|nr:preprotein translocase subunit YajC [Alkaliphilus oremlandii]ABW19261.1 preprotein translocase, YajC subunit [Alkaliphilus oremlandii OhILAs]
MPAAVANLVLPLGVFVVFYFILIRPQQKKDKKIKEMRNNLKVGDEVITIGGIHGKVTKIKEDIMTLEVGADKVKLTMSKWAVGTVTQQEKSIEK